MLIINEYEEEKYKKNSIQNRDDMAANVDVVGCMKREIREAIFISI